MREGRVSDVREERRGMWADVRGEGWGRRGKGEREKTEVIGR